MPLSVILYYRIFRRLCSLPFVVKPRGASAERGTRHRKTLFNLPDVNLTVDKPDAASRSRFGNSGDAT